MKGIKDWIIAIGFTMSLMPTVVVLITILAALYNGMFSDAGYQTVVKINTVGEALPDLITIVGVTVLGFIGVILLWKKIFATGKVEI